MKNLITTLICSLLLLGYSQQAAAQAADCFTAGLSPFCGGIAQYAANSDGTGSGAGPQAPAGPNYDCLGTQSNPTYFSVTIDQAGSIDFTLDNTSGNDIDFILWGPFNGLSAASNACDSMGTGGVWGDVADCSYSISGQEQVTVANTQVGEVYILMVSNYENTPTNIFSTSNIGTGSIACACDIPVVVDTLSAAFGNQGFLADTTGGVQQFVVCANNTVGFRVSAGGSLNDTLSLYGPFTSIPAVTPNFSTFEAFPRAPSFDTIDIFVLMTPDETNIGVSDFTVGVSNKINTGTTLDSSCFDQIQMQLVVPGVRLNDRMVCSGEQFQILTDSVPTTALGSSSYTWSQISGTPVTFSSTTAPEPFVTIATTSSTSSNDSIVIVVDYNYGSLCPISDTMVLRFPDNNITFTASMDSVCAGQTTTLSAVLADTFGVPICNDYTISTIPLAPVAGSGTRLNLGDDQLSAGLPLGFDFDFYCNTYNTFAISSNGFITFDLAAGSGCCSGELLPDAGFFGSVNDVIAMCWTDCSPNNGGVIEYFTVGTAPNRRLIVNFTNVPPFSTGTGTQTVQAILHETTNVIEIHATNVTPSGTIFANEVTLGIENSDGTIAHAPASTNATTTAFSNVAYRFSPVLVGPFYTFTPSTGTPNTVSNPTVTINATTTYSVVVTDDVCAYQDTILITAISNYAAPTVMCDSSGNTSISVSWNDIGLPAGGFYEYSLDSGATWTTVGPGLSTTITGLNNNTTYNISIRGDDNTGGICTLSAIGMTNCTTLNPDCSGNPAINIVLNATDVLCNGGATACINATLSGGSGNPFSSLVWSNGITNVDSICNLAAGNYTLVVTDTFSGTSSLISCVDSMSITVLEPTAVDVVVDSTTNPTCSGSADGSIYITATGGTGSYTYLWPNATTVEDITGLNNGTYIVTVSDANNCTDTVSATLTVPNPILISVDNITNNSCAGTTDGSITISATGGVGALSYLWANGTTTVTNTAIAEGTYIVSVTDANNCMDTAQATVIPTVFLTTTDATTNPNCFGQSGNSTVTVAGGSGSYTFDWGTSSTSTTGTATLAGGTHIVTITDGGNGCMTMDTVTITVPDSITITTVNVNNITCTGAINSGSIDINISGGTAPYSFNWSTGATTEDLVSLTAGSYTLTVTDGNNCTQQATYNVAGITPINVTINTLVGMVGCDLTATGSAVAVATGGSGFTYNWSTGTANDTIINLAAGTYTVTATNSDGCTNTANVTITAPVIPTLAVSVGLATGQQADTIQPSENTTVFATGGAGQSYNWTATGAGNPAIATPNAASTIVTPDAEGNYTYTVVTDVTTNGTNCTATDSVTVTVEPAYLGIPDAFTPNGDGLNDLFRPVTLQAKEVIQFRIYNRLGQLVYTGDDLENDGWDGNLNGVAQARDVYMYVLEYKRATDNNVKSVRGQVTLLR